MDRELEFAKSVFFGCKKHPFLKVECGLDIKIYKPIISRYRKMSFSTLRRERFLK